MIEIWVEAARALLAPPGVLLVIAGLLIPFVGAGARKALLFVTPPAVLTAVWADPFAATAVGLWGMELAPYVSTTLGRLFATAFLLMVFFGNLFALRCASTAESAAAQIYAGSAVCVVLAGDFLTLFLFWEISAVASAAVIFAGQTSEARAATMRYLFMHVLSGVVMLVGLAGLAQATGDLSVRVLSTENWYARGILIGALINVGAPPFSAWIADAYPRASASGSVYLSAFTTKASVFLLLAVFPGEAILIPLGVFMIFYGIVFALLENDMRRILAYSIVNQVGFMVVGAGLGTAAAINAVSAHAFVHIIYKGLLLMSAGGVLFVVGRNRCSDLGGLYKSMPWTTAAAIIGGASISAVPFTSGYITKPLALQAALGMDMTWLWFLLVAAGAGVFLHAGIKYVWFVFFQLKPLRDAPESPLSMRLAMGAFAAICLGIGVAPGLLYEHLPYAVGYAPYTPSHLVDQTQLLAAAAVAFFALLPWMKRTETILLDFDWFYRKPGMAVLRMAVAAARGVGGCVSSAVASVGAGLLRIGERAFVSPRTRVTVPILKLTFTILFALLFVAAYVRGV